MYFGYNFDRGRYESSGVFDNKFRFPALVSAQEKNGVQSSGSSRAKTQMSEAFGRRWRVISAEEKELYDELEEADKARYEREACAQDTAALRLL